MSAVAKILDRELIEARAELEHLREINADTVARGRRAQAEIDEQVAVVTDIESAIAMLDEAQQRRMADAEVTE